VTQAGVKIDHHRLNGQFCRGSSQMNHERKGCEHNQIFYRKSRGVELTPGGEVLQGYARRIMHLLDEAGKAVQDSDKHVGRLNLGTLETIAAVRLPPTLARFRHTYPEVELQLTTGSTEFLATEVLNYRLDGAFVAGSPEYPEIEQQLIYDETLVLVSELGRQQIDNLRDEVLLVFRPGCAYRARAELWLREEGLLPLRKMEFGALDAILGCVIAGMGVSLLPRVVVERPQYRELLRIHQIPERYRQMPSYFIRRRDALETHTLRAFVDMTAS
jgi:DNA-binding transcriptional LysR family regulator